MTRKNYCRLIVFCVLLLLATGTLAQEPPPMAKILNIATYSDFIVGWQQTSNEILREKIRLVDSLYQMPEKFFAAEQALNDRLQAWQDSVMTAYKTDIKTYLKFGVKNKKKIEKFMEEAGYKATLDSLQAVSAGLDSSYSSRIEGYNIYGSGK